MTIREKLKPVDSATLETIERIVKARLGPFLERVEVEPERDHYDDPMLLVHAYIRYTPTPLDTRPFFGLGAELWQALWAKGEERFPLLRYHFDERQVVTPS